jgi:hypothetical protein
VYVHTGAPTVRTYLRDSSWALRLVPTETGASWTSSLGVPSDAMFARVVDDWQCVTGEDVGRGWRVV